MLVHALEHTRAAQNTRTSAQHHTGVELGQRRARMQQHLNTNELERCSMRDQGDRDSECNAQRQGVWRRGRDMLGKSKHGSFGTVIHAGVVK